MRILIVEDQLIDEGSHHLSQIEDIARHARTVLGAKVDILANRSFSSENANRLGAEACLEGVSPGRATAAVRGLARMFILPIRVLRNAVTITRHIMQKGPYDVLFVPTAWLPHVAALLPCAVLAGSRVRAIALQFLCCWDSGRLKGRLELRATRLLLRLLRQLRPELLLFGQTHTVCAEIQGDSDLKVEWMPDVAAAGSLISNDRPESAESSVATRGSSATKVFGSYGFARHEQGSDVLQDAIALFLKAHPEADVRFDIFWPNGVFMVDGKPVSPRAELEATGKVRFFREARSKNETLQLLRETDWVLLPYRKESYSKRSSLLATDAICMGVPGIYTEGTFLQFLFQEHGCGLPMQDGSVESLVQAIRSAVFDGDKFSQASRDRRRRAEDNFSAASFWARISASSCQLGKQA